MVINPGFLTRIAATPTPGGAGSAGNSVVNNGELSKGAAGVSEKAGQAGASMGDLEKMRAGAQDDATKRIIDYITDNQGAIDTNKDGKISQGEIGSDQNIKGIQDAATASPTDLSLLSFDKQTLQGAYSNIQAELPAINNGGASKDELTQYKSDLDAKLKADPNNNTLKAQTTLVNEMVSRFDAMDASKDSKLTNQEFKADEKVRRALDGPQTPAPTPTPPPGGGGGGIGSPASTTARPPGRLLNLKG